jgi:hypothetical protein
MSMMWMKACMIKPLPSIQLVVANMIFLVNFHIVATKKNLGKIVQVFFSLTSKRCHIMKETILVTIYKQEVPIIAKSKQKYF